MSKPKKTYQNGTQRSYSYKGYSINIDMYNPSKGYGGGSRLGRGKPYLTFYFVTSEGNVINGIGGIRNAVEKIDKHYS